MFLSSNHPRLLLCFVALNGLLLLGYFCLRWLRRDKIPAGRKALPGPPVNHVGGNEGQFNPLSPFLTFENWARTYGPIFKVKVAKQTIISVNDPKLAKELFEKRGSKYSGRPTPHVFYDILSQRSRIVLTPNGPKHTAFRRQIHNLLSISRTKDNSRIQELESRHLLQDLVEYSNALEQNAKSLSNTGFDPEQPIYTQVQRILRRYTLSVMMTLSFSHRVRNLNDPTVKTVFQIMDDMARAAAPGQYLVDELPVLSKLPSILQPWAKELAERSSFQWSFLSNLIGVTEKQMEKGIPNTGLIRTLLEQRRGMNETEKTSKFLDDKCVAYQSMTLMEAGADTTSIALMNFLMAMVSYPAIMQKAQKAIDAVVPPTRLPTYEDVKAAPYINQIAKEVMRWRPVLPMGVPHMNTVDDEVDGYHIPAGSIILGNMWAMQHDPTAYDHPEQFRPERFENSKHKSAFESSTEADAADRDHYIFGWGRRICPGMHLAEASVLLLTARMLWAFDITPMRDENGRDIEITTDPEVAYDHSAIENPKPFPVRFKLSSPEREKVIGGSFQEASEIWKTMNLDLFQEEV